MLWIEEVEMVDSVDDLKSSRSIRGHTHYQNFELLDARIASALSKIIQNSSLRKEVILEEQKAQIRGSTPSQKTDRLHDPRLLTGYWRS